LNSVVLSLSEEEQGGLLRRIKWFLFLRVVILSFFLGAAGLLPLIWGKPSDISDFRALQFPLIAAYALSLISALILPRLKNLNLFSHVQVNFDVLLITGIIFITGGVGSPFSFLYNLAVMNGSILLFYRGGFIIAGFSGACYGAVLLGLHYWTVDSVTLSH